MSARREPNVTLPRKIRAWPVTTAVGASRYLVDELIGDAGFVLLLRESPLYLLLQVLGRMRVGLSLEEVVFAGKVETLISG